MRWTEALSRDATDDSQATFRRVPVSWVEGCHSGKKCPGPLDCLDTRTGETTGMIGLGEQKLTPESPQPREPSDIPLIPKDLKVKLKEQRLFIEWNDGRHSDLLLSDLRRQCPCAACRTERDEQAKNPLRILKYDPGTLRVTGARLVGRYAIQFTWSDGHDTGIFDFRFLHSLQEPESGS